MPELPEVETTAALVRPHVEGRVVRAVGVDWERTLGGATPEEFERTVVGATLARVGRRAKWIVIDLEREGTGAGALLCHLRMSGRLVVDPEGAAPQPFQRVELALDGPDGRAAGRLRFLDVRKFGRFRFVPDPDAFLADLGPEPLGPECTADWFARALRSRKRALKPLLLDQTFLAGLGNIYVDESLFLAGLHPLRRSDRVPRARADALHAAIQSTLRAAIEREGSSFDTFYRTPEGQPGSYQHLFRVYGRDGQPCPECGRAIKKLVVGQRGTHVCTRCQPAPRARSSAASR
ncbi:MAG: bifunctional DNA-formamidopyrimidine glycosylase/DNA-(apurinic or apyrimidinic site) lyase [Planctomycetota bacterium]